jgi:superfamily II DNA/RNA helicase
MMSFSATVTSELQQLLGRYIGSEYTNIKIAAQSIVVDRIDHAFIRIQGRHKEEMLEKYLEAHKDQKILIFTQMKHVASTVARNLHDQGYKVAALHGDIDQRVRNITIKDIKADKVKILVATDVASRGLNLNDIQLVINYDVPQDPESYVHRIGRTARAGQSGKAITLVTESEMSSIHAIERKNKIQIKEIDADGNEKPRTYTKHHDAGFAYKRSRSGGGYRGRSGGGSRGGYSAGGRSSDRPTYSSARPAGDRPAYGADRPARPAGDRPAYGASRPSYGSDRPR